MSARSKEKGQVETPALAEKEVGAGGTQHVPVLDGIRGLAILLVLIHHQIRNPPYTPFLHWLEQQTGKFWCGVDLFFVLSGFLITRGLLVTREKPHYFKNFYVRRALRIFPLYFLWVGLITIVFATQRGWDGKDVPMREKVAPTATASADPSATSRPEYKKVTIHQEGVKEAVLPWWFYAGNIAMAVRGDWFSETGVPGVNHFWSLCVEEHFYLLWPLVIFFVPAKRVWWVANLLMLFPLLRIWWFSSQTHLAIYVLTPTRIDSLMVGGVIAMAAAHYGLDAVYACARKLTPLALFGWYWAWQYLSDTPWSHRMGFTVIAILFAHLIVMALGSKGVLKKIFEWGWLRMLGKYSYGLYVIHGVLMTYTVDGALRDTIATWTDNPYVHQLLLAIICLGGYFILARTSYELFESKFLKLKKKFQ